MRRLIFSGGIFECINEIVHAVNVETGVRIFGDIGDCAADAAAPDNNDTLV